MVDAQINMPNGDRPNLDPNRNRDRDHVVPMPYWYAFMVACQIASMAGALGVIFPQPLEGFAMWPSLRFLIWAVSLYFSQVTFSALIPPRQSTLSECARIILWRTIYGRKHTIAGLG
jgi:hypothetical protein